MQRMLCRCLSLTSFPSGLANWNVSKVENMLLFSSFYELSDRSKLTDVSPIANWNVSKVENMNNIVQGLVLLSSVILPHWNTSNVTGITGMCNHDSELTTFDMSYWNTSKVTQAGAFLRECSKQGSLFINALTKQGSLFINALTKLDLVPYFLSHAGAQKNRFSSLFPFFSI